MANRSVGNRVAVISVIAFSLAGCNAVGGAGTVKPQLPPLPIKLGCTAPVAHVGEDARAFAARAVAAFNCEKHTLDETVRFYNDLQRRLTGK